ncbi:glutamate synthase-related protein [Sphingopyxis sp. BSNA05]|uniref:glutamate synthase-related protein n=1 Tax=Sphingopyxis sp. BSNA05 TaxID=1236614 RepID=UPI0020B72DE6|nr:glutamate synthase-related protein [Sphingopyxis sp. BSNA05]
MSFGALSVPAIRALSHGAKLAGCWLNTGEGGLSPFHLEGGCDIIFQIGTAKYGVRDQDAASARTSCVPSLRTNRSGCSRSSCRKAPSPARAAYCPARR